VVASGGGGGRREEAKAKVSDGVFLACLAFLKTRGPATAWASRAASLCVSVQSLIESLPHPTARTWSSLICMPCLRANHQCPCFPLAAASLTQHQHHHVITLHEHAPQPHQTKQTMKTLSLLLLLVALFVVLSPAAAYKKRKEWTEEELEALEKAWEANDAEEELDTPERRYRLEMEARKTKKAPAAAAR